MTSKRLTKCCNADVSIYDMMHVTGQDKQQYTCNKCEKKAFGYGVPPEDFLVPVFVLHREPLFSVDIIDNSSKFALIFTNRVSKCCYAPVELVSPDLSKLPTKVRFSTEDIVCLSCKKKTPVWGKEHKGWDPINERTIHTYYGATEEASVEEIQHISIINQIKVEFPNTIN